MPELQVLNGPLQWKTIRVEGSRFVIGRKDGCHLVLKDGWVSREHTLIIEPRPGEYLVQDLDSENGTYVNGTRIRERAVQHGDVLRVGRTELRFVTRPLTHGIQAPPGAGGELSATPSDGTTIPQPAGNGLPSSQRPRPRLEPPTLQVETPRPIERAPTGTDPLAKTTADPTGVHVDRHQLDLRERVRRLEKRVLEMEEARAAMAAENAVLKRALANVDLIDRETGQFTPPRVVVPPAARIGVPETFLPLVSNPRASIHYRGPAADAAAEPALPTPGPSLLRAGILGVGTFGTGLASAFARLGYRSVAASATRAVLGRSGLDPARTIALDAGEAKLATKPDLTWAALEPRLAGLSRTVFAGCELVLLCACAGESEEGHGLQALVEMLRATRADLRIGVILCVPAAAAAAGIKCEEGRRADLEGMRLLSEAGRLAPVILCDREGQADAPGAPAPGDTTVCESAAGILDGLLRLAVMPTHGAQPAQAALREMLFDKGWCALGAAATTSTDPAAIPSAVRFAVDEGLLSRMMPASRARTSWLCALTGSEILAKDPALPGRLESALEEASGVLPQARRLHGVYQDVGKSVRVLALVGGLPFAEEPPPGPARRP